MVLDLDCPQIIKIWRAIVPAYVNSGNQAAMAVRLALLFP